jgi:hypothetical protein
MRFRVKASPKGLLPDMQCWTIEAQWFGPANRVGQVTRDSKVELHETVSGDQFEAGILVGEIGEDDVEVIADSGQLPVTAALVGGQGDARSDDVARRMTQDSFDLRGLLQVGEGVRQRAAGAGEDGAPEALAGGWGVGIHGIAGRIYLELGQAAQCQILSTLIRDR